MVNESVYSGDKVTFQSNKVGKAYLVKASLDSAKVDTVDKLNALINVDPKGESITAANVLDANTDTTIVAPLKAGTYKLIVTDARGNVSSMSKNDVIVQQIFFPSFSSIYDTATINQTPTWIGAGFVISSDVTNATISYDFSSLGVSIEPNLNDQYSAGGAWVRLTPEMSSEMISNNGSVLTLSNINASAGDAIRLALYQKTILGPAGTKNIVVTFDADGNGPLSPEIYTLRVNVVESN